MRREFLVIFDSCMSGIWPDFRLIFLWFVQSKSSKNCQLTGLLPQPHQGDQNSPCTLVPSLARTARQNPNSTPADDLRSSYSNSTPRIIFHGTPLLIHSFYFSIKAVAWRHSAKKLFLKVSLNLHENISAGVYFW